MFQTTALEVGVEFPVDVLRQALLKATAKGKDDQFGISVTIDEDIVAVGASQEDGDHNSTAANPNDNALDAGAVYMYH